MKNIGNNRINTRLTPEDLAAIKQAIREIDARMPFLLGLTLEERRKLPKMNRSNKLFVSDSLEVVQENPQMLPHYLTPDALENDFVLFQQLGEILLPLEQLFEKVRDSQIMAGSEAYQTSLVIYKLMRVAAEAGMPGMDTAYAKLRVRFEGQGPQGTTDEDATTSGTDANTSDDPPEIDLNAAA